MRAITLRRKVLLTLVLLSLMAGSSFAEEVEDKFRLSIGVGAFSGLDAIESDSANTLTLVDRRDNQASDLFRDPRNDSAVFGRLNIDAGPILTVRGQYAFTRIFLLEASVGYQRSEVSDIEVQAQFFGVSTPQNEQFNFAFFRFKAGELERVPLQFTAMWRFRPRSRLNPYFGLGIGYTFVGFQVSDELNSISQNMDKSLGQQMVLSSGLFGNDSLSPTGEIRDLAGATLDVNDTFEWHLAGGLEYSLNQKWSLMLDLRWTISSRTIGFGFNEGDYLGIPVPNARVFDDTPLASQQFGAVLVTDVGIIDGGSLQPDPLSDPDTDCLATPAACSFVVGAFDGVPDLGAYYVQGGNLAYDGLGIEFGFRYTF